MSLTPTKHRTLARQRSSPSLTTVGIPAAIPQIDLFASYSASARIIKRTRSHPRIHRGDVSSSATSSAGDDSDSSDSFLSDHTTPVKTASSNPTTPKRKVVSRTMEPMSVGRPKAGSSRDTLQARLNAVAKVRPSKSMDGFSIPPVPPLPSSPSKLKMSTKPFHRSGSPEKPRSGPKSDKVIVCVRVKPTTSTFAHTAYEITPTSLTLSDSHPNVVKRGGKAGREDEYTYTFAHLLQHPSTTPELYEAKVAPLVHKAMNGFNSTIFAYGQTGSGKSFTMSGIPSQLGIIPCAVDGVFDAINESLDRAYLLRVSYIEIYNETLRDLLTDKKGPLKPQDQPVIHTGNGKVYVEPLVEKVVSTPQDVVDLLAHGNNMRKIGATDWNEQSSRSHSVFTIVIESRPRDGGAEDDIRLSRLNLIDLAGSEKAVSDLERRSEGKHINKSLLALREVINKLTEKNRTHVPYRNSKLTHLLENALGGDSNICVICTLSAEEANCAETLETLKFAGRCSQVETQAKKNVLLCNDKALIRAKDLEIQDLRRRLDGMHSSDDNTEESSEQISQLADSVAAMEERKARLQDKLAKLNGEILTSEVLPRSMSGLPMSPKMKRRRISEISSVGLGTPKKGMGDRRAVSNMMRLAEEDTTPTLIEVTETTSTFSDDVVASLRRRLAAKETELATANQELCEASARLAQLAHTQDEVQGLKEQLNSLLAERQALIEERRTVAADREDKLRDAHSQIESTRSELVKTVNERSSTIDKLEQTILELRKSREELALEDQDRYDELKKELDEQREMIRSERDARRLADSSHAGIVDDLRREKSEADAHIDHLKRDLESTATKHAQSSQALDAAVNSLQGQLAEAHTRINSLDAEHARLNTEHARIVSERSELERDRQDARDDLDRFQRAAMSNETNVVSELRAEIAKLREEREETDRTRQLEADDLRKALKDEKDNVLQLDRRLESLSAESQKALASSLEENQTSLARQADLDRQLEQLRTESKAQLDEERRTISMLVKDVEAQQQTIAEAVTKESVLVSARASADLREEELAREIARLKQALSAESRKRADESAQRVGEVEAQLHEQQSRADRLQDMVHDANERENALRAEMTSTQTALETARREAAEGKTRQTRIAELEASEKRFLEQQQATTTREQAIRQQVTLLREASEQAVKAEQARADAALLELEEARAKVVALEQRERAMLGDVDARERDLTQQLERARVLAVESERHVEEARTALEQETALRRAAEATSTKAEEKAAQGTSDMAQLKIDNSALRQSLEAVQVELRTAEDKALASSEKAAALAKEVVVLKASLPSSTSTLSIRARHTISASDPSLPNNVVINSLRTQALTSASTGNDSHSPAAKLLSAEKDEIDRLAKIVEAQKLIIDDQKEKIKFWARELEQQREIVRALTMNPDMSPKSRASPRGHSKTKSVPNVESPGMGGTPKKPFPSTFTAFNLALPTTPTPLPMHGSQFDNTSARKGRRVTIEHDIDVLMDSSKVNKARAMFDRPGGEPLSPSKAPTTPRRVAVPASLPKQRRP